MSADDDLLVNASRAAAGNAPAEPAAAAPDATLRAADVPAAAGSNATPRSVGVLLASEVTAGFGARPAAGVSAKVEAGPEATASTDSAARPGDASPVGFGGPPAVEAAGSGARPGDANSARSAKRPGAFAQFRLLLAKDLRQEFRTREMLTSMGLYAFLVLIVLGAAFTQVDDLRAVSKLAGGLVWVIIVFAALLGLGRSFSYEKEGGALEGLLLAPVDRGAIYLAKFVSNLLFLGIVEIIVLPLFYFFFLTAADPSPTFFASVLPLALGTVGISAVGTLLATITSNARSRDVLLAVLFIPVLFPLLYACVAATTAALAGSVEMGGAFGIGVMGCLGYDVIMAAVSWLLYDYVVG